MFDQINGLPVHALVVHAAVVFVPLLALAAVVYALVPRLRDRVGWVAFLLALAAPGAALVAKQSGEAFFRRKYQQTSTDGMGLLAEHEQFGNVTAWVTVALGVVTVALIVLTSRGRTLPRPAEWVAAVVVVALAGVAAWYVFQAGDSGATSVHGGG